MVTQELTMASLYEVQEKIRNRELSPVELTQQMLKNLELSQGVLNAMVTITPEIALAQANRAEQEILSGNYRGPLHGVPIVYKDLYYTKNVRTTASSKILSDFVPDYDATVVRHLTDAGAVMLGKSQTHEFAKGGLTDSPHFGPCRNPWQLDRVPGGSSGGSAAVVAAGLAFMGTGSDTAGSIRIPAACCGVVGLKPTYGRVSRHGIFPLAWSLDHVGPITRSVWDAAICLGVMAGYDSHDPTTVTLPVPDYTQGLTDIDLTGVKVGVPIKQYFEDLDPEIKAGVLAAVDRLSDLGAECREVEIPNLEYTLGVQMAIGMSEAAAIHHQWLSERIEDYAPDVRWKLEAGRFISAVDYLRASQIRPFIQQGFSQVLSEVDVLVTPTLPIVAPFMGTEMVSVNGKPESVSDVMIRFTHSSNVTGFPTLALPCGFNSENLPMSMQLIGRPFAETDVLRVGYAYEQVTQWHTRHPHWENDLT